MISLLSLTSPFSLIIAILLAIIAHHVLFFVFKFKGPAKGERLFFSEDKQRFRINYREYDAQSPVVIFESHLGMPLEIWSWVERELSDVSTLSYDRIGYGWSSLYLSEKRDLTAAANDLLRVLLAIPVLHMDNNKRKFLEPKSPIINGLKIQRIF
jgi:hypothetical protein